MSCSNTGPRPVQARRSHREAADRIEDLPDLDFTFLRRPDGHEVGGIFGLPDAPSSTWVTIFEVADTDAAAARATATGGASDAPQDIPNGRMAAITDPFGTEFSVIARRAGPPG